MWLNAGLMTTFMHIIEQTGYDDGHAEIFLFQRRQRFDHFFPVVEDTMNDGGIPGIGNNGFIRLDKPVPRFHVSQVNRIKLLHDFQKPLQFFVRSDFIHSFGRHGKDDIVVLQIFQSAAPV